MLVEEAHDLISAHSTDVNAVFTFASGGFDRLLGMDPTVSRRRGRCCPHPGKCSGLYIVLCCSGGGGGGGGGDLAIFARMGMPLVFCL